MIVNETADSDAQALIEQITEETLGLLDAVDEADWKKREQHIDSLKQRLQEDYGIAYNIN